MTALETLVHIIDKHSETEDEDGNHLEAISDYEGESDEIPIPSVKTCQEMVKNSGPCRTNTKLSAGTVIKPVAELTRMAGSHVTEAMSVFEVVFPNSLQ